jgi:hypothetical protein
MNPALLALALSGINLDPKRETPICAECKQPITDPKDDWVSESGKHLHGKCIPGESPRRGRS